MSVRLETELHELNAKTSADRLRETVITLFAELHDGRTDEELLFHPMEAEEFCGVVRYKLKDRNLPDNLILRTLINTRKANKR